MVYQRRGQENWKIGLRRLWTPPHWNYLARVHQFWSLWSQSRSTKMFWSGLNSRVYCGFALGFKTKKSFYSFTSNLQEAYVESPNLNLLKRGHISKWGYGNYMDLATPMSIIEGITEYLRYQFFSFLSLSRFSYILKFIYIQKKLYLPISVQNIFFFYCTQTL